MGFGNGKWVSVFGVYPKTEGITQIQVTASVKNRETGQYDTDFSGYISCVGKGVAQKALQLKPTKEHPVRIRLGDVEVKQVMEIGSDGKRFPKYTNWNIYSFDFGENYGGNGGGRGGDSAYSEPSNPAYDGTQDAMDEEGLPF